MMGTAWTEGGATFSKDGRFRHHLWRSRPSELFGKHLIHPGRRLGVCMHNPSKAGADPINENDPTVVKLCGFGDRWLCTRVDVANLSDYCATKPRDLYAAGFPISDVCDRYIREVAAASDIFIVAWGALTKRVALERAAHVMRLVEEAAPGRPIYCIAKTGDGQPWHPLMARYTDVPLTYIAAPPPRKVTP